MAEILVTPVIALPSVSLTLTGVVEAVVVPSPRYPSVLEPQHFTPPDVNNAHVYPQPAATSDTPEVRPDTVTGVVRSVYVPSPNCPEELLPQHFTAPPEVTKHA